MMPSSSASPEDPPRQPRRWWAPKRQRTERNSKAMSQANVEAIQNLFRAVEERDLETYLAAWDHEVVIREPGSLPYGGEYLGPEGVRRHASAWLRTWSDLQPGAKRKLGAACG